LTLLRTLAGLGAAWLIAGTATGKTWEVCPSCPISSLRAAIERAAAHDTIYLAAGRYFEHDLLIRKPLTIIGPREAIIDGQNKGGVFQVSADSFTLKGIAIRNVSFSELEENSAITLLRCTHYHLEDLHIDSVYFGILVENSDSGVVRNCVIRSSTSGTDEATMGNGIHLWKCENALIADNYVTGMRDGIYFEFVQHSTIERNVSKGNLRYGLHFMFSNHDVYRNNRFENNGAGVAVMFSRNIEMYGNTFIHNWGNNAYGLLLKEIYDGVIQHNHFIRNTVAVQNEGSVRIRYEENDFYFNGWAVNYMGGAYDNYFHHNNFVGNTFEVSYFGRPNNNRFEENYWSKYNGYDLNRDGLGDVPHYPVDLFTYLAHEVNESIILLRSLFVTLLSFAEKVAPVLTPDDIYDPTPLMNLWHWSDSTTSTSALAH